MRRRNKRQRDRGVSLSRREEEEGEEGIGFEVEEKDKGDRKEEDGKMVGVSKVGTQVQLTDLSCPIWSSLTL